jgi:hypothetical protein
MELLRTRAADLPALDDIFIEAIAAVYRPHGFDPPAPPLDVFANQQRHVLAHDAERCTDGEVRVQMPGSSRDVVSTAPAAGLRLAPAPGLLLLGPEVAAPTSLAIGSYTLF